MKDTIPDMRHLPILVFGLTGLPSVGKGEVASELLRRANGRGVPAEHLSFSGQIKEEAASRGLRVESMDRADLLAIAREMREAEGPGVLAKRIIRKIYARQPNSSAVFVVEAIRHVAEIELLRQAFGDRFVLIAVTAAFELIVERMFARRRPDESRDAMRSKERAFELLRREWEGDDSDLSVNVAACVRQADVVVENNATLAALRERVGEIFDNVWRSQLSQECPTEA